MWQIPLYEGMMETSHLKGVAFCTRAAAGDALIALVAYWAAAGVARDKLWLLSPGRRDWIIFLSIGTVITIIVEYLSTKILGRWGYAEIMPTLPIIETGLSPLAQWLIVPPIVLWLAKRHVMGSRTAFH
ncbi:hypothetical protein KQH29_00275 [bacterium]|nr:hypothetical protein [bacterium]